LSGAKEFLYSIVLILDLAFGAFFGSRAYSKMMAQYLANAGHGSTIQNQCDVQEAQASEGLIKGISIVSRPLINESVCRKMTTNQFIDKGQYHDR